MADTQAIRDRIDIVQLIGEYVPIKKAGANWKANCPFHHEKTPSFMASQEKQIWHCFGCGKGGDIFSFLQEMEGLEFPEALKILAEKAGVKLDNYASEVSKSQKNRILEINQKAAYFFHHFLLEMPTAKPARDYLERRGLKKETTEDWQIGYIPDQWDLLTGYFLKKGCAIDDLVAAGLAIKKEGADIKSRKGFYDRFRGRIMFPIWDVHGNIVGFTGRILVETEKSGGKYVNTPQTPAYDKSRVLYGLNKAKTAIKEKDFAVLVEGQMDVIACHQAGFKNVIASSGTALTFEQIKLIKRYTDNAAMAFDADAAGQNAAKKGIDAAVEQGMNTKVIQIPPGCGKDADECIKKDPSIWAQALKNAKDIMDWHFSRNLSGLDKNDPKQKQKVAEILLTEIGRIPYAVEKDHWLNRLANELSVDVQTLKTEISRVKGKDLSKPAEAVNLDAMQKPEKIRLLAESLLALLLKFPQAAPALRKDLDKDCFSYSDQAGVLYESVRNGYNIKDAENKEVENLVNFLLLKADKDYADYSREEAEKETVLLADQIAKEWKRKKKEELLNLLRSAEQSGDKETVRNYLNQIIKLEQTSI